MKNQTPERNAEKKTQSGFTLIEMSIFIIFFGLFAGILMNYLISYQTEQRKSQTETNLSRAHGAIVNFYGAEGRYPCPADPRLGPDDPDYGVEKCGNGQLPADPSAVSNGYLVDVDGDGEGEEIMAGAIPFKTIELAVEGYDLDGSGNKVLISGDASVEDQEMVQNLDMKDQVTEDLIYDAYGNKLTYVVTRELTNRNTFDETQGAIVIVDEFTEINTDFFINLNPAEMRMAHYVIISHGPDGKGAYNRSGNIVETCAPVIEGEEDDDEAPPPGGMNYATQLQNCKVSSAAEMDAAFMMGLYNSTRNAYYDDMMIIGDLSTSEAWAQSGSGIKALNEGNVGVGTQAPEAKLHVDNGNMRGNKFQSEKFCDVSGEFCITSDMIASPSGHDSMRCPDRQVIKGIYDGAVDCALPVFNMLNASCAPGSYLRGITVSGNGTTVPLCTSL